MTQTDTNSKESAEEIIRELVFLKKYKDLNGKDDLYSYRQPRVWEAAKLFLTQLKNTEEYASQSNSDEPYFGWCNVEGCEKEAANGGTCWRETGYWTVCSKHSSEYREGKPQPQMKQSAIDREKRRGADGVLVDAGENKLNEKQ